MLGSIVITSATAKIDILPPCRWKMNSINLMNLTWELFLKQNQQILLWSSLNRVVSKSTILFALLHLQFVEAHDTQLHCSYRHHNRDEYWMIVTTLLESIDLAVDARESRQQQ
ncbi:hypothetical protein CsSME_00011019 [Camellia sinensis var. sinensis]